jgi:hypothetical protein
MMNLPLYTTPKKEKKGKDREKTEEEKKNTRENPLKMLHMMTKPN